MTKAEELAIKLQDELIDMDSPGDIVIHLMSALQEYGAIVRKRDAEIALSHVDPEWPNDETSNVARFCSAAIEQEKLP